jgi:hypothetical protein
MVTTQNGTGKTAPVKRIHSLHVPVRSAITPPPVRLALCLASALEADGEWRTEAWTAPVVALHARVEDRWECESAARPAEPHPADLDALRRAGWRFCERVEAFGALFVSPYDGGFVGSTLNPWDVDGMVFEVTPAPWPEAEDVGRLKPVLNRLTELALGRARRDHGRKAAAGATLSPAGGAILAHPQQGLIPDRRPDTAFATREISCTAGTMNLGE